ncbi:MAG: D-alanine--D-alanine ligase [Bacilli bacterium]|nr:D-alanine--D-alanine ligase [Bacilli bacterium]
MRIKVGVIFGGESVEHEVSIISAIQAMNKINQEKYEIIPIYIDKKREWYTGHMLMDIDTFSDMSLLKKYATNVVLYYKGGKYVLQNKKGFKRIVTDIDIALPIVHGTNVEDGVLQGYLTSIGIPFTGSNVYASVVGQDKVYMKNIFEHEKLPITKYVWFYDNEYKDNEEEVLKRIKKLSYPVIVKPATTGSSVGIAVCKDDKELIDGLDEAINYDNKIIVEELVENLKECNIAILGNYESQTVSAIEEVLSSNKFLTYEDKYIGSSKVKGKLGAKVPAKGSKGMASAAREIPAKIPKDMQEEIETMALKAFKALGSSGVCRFDFLIDSKTKKVYINEINSIPGSLSFYLFEPINIDYTELLNNLINIGVKDYKKRISKTHSFDSNILAGYQARRGVKGTKKLK